MEPQQCKQKLSLRETSKMNLIKLFKVYCTAKKKKDRGKETEPSWVFGWTPTQTNDTDTC